MNKLRKPASPITVGIILFVLMIAAWGMANVLYSPMKLVPVDDIYPRVEYFNENGAHQN